MKTFLEITIAIEEEMFKAGKESIDYSAEKDDRFVYDVYTYIESKNHVIHFDFSAYDCGSGFHVNHIKFEQNSALPNIIDKLNKTNCRYE